MRLRRKTTAIVLAVVIAAGLAIGTGTTILFNCADRIQCESTVH